MPHASSAKHVGSSKSPLRATFRLCLVRTSTSWNRTEHISSRRLAHGPLPIVLIERTRVWYK